jgi:hypothetical protein
LVWLQARYQYSATNSSLWGKTSKVAIVGNSYTNNPTALTADYDSLVSHDFTSIQLFRLDLTTSAGINAASTISAGTAALFSDPFTWSLY